ncbi:MAG: HlyD family secretion protein [Pseudomonadota bacterium]|jgi:multidrug efflux system membrane fusion protein
MTRSAQTVFPVRAAGRILPWLLVGLLAVAGVGGWWWHSHQKPQAQTAGQSHDGSSDNRGSRAHGGPGGRATPPSPVSVQVARRQDIRVLVTAIGNIAASNTAIVHAQVSGVLQRLDFVEGQQVKAGQLLAQIDPRSFQASLDQSQGALLRDQAQLENAKIDLTRYQGLLAKDAIPKQQLDTQVALVHQLEGTVKLDQAAVASAQLQLSYTRVTAPIAGRVGLKQVDLGNVIQPTDVNGVVIITQTRPIALTFAVPASNIPVISKRLHGGVAMPVQAFDRGGKQPLAVGTVATVDNSIDVTTDTIKVKALFPNLDDSLFPNQAVNVTLQLDTLHDVLAVPQAAVLRGTQGAYVYVVGADNKVSVRVVQPGAADANWVAVQGELQAGDKVVIDGSDRLRPGATVEVITGQAQHHAAPAIAH